MPSAGWPARVASVMHRVGWGTAQALAEVLRTTHTGTVIHTAYLERLNAPFRRALAPLGRRGRAIAPLASTLTAGMYWVGCAYHFCGSHRSLRGRTGEGASRPWRECTPAMAAGLTPSWTLAELLRYQVPLSLGVPPQRRGRPPKRIHPPLMAGAT
jgi:hypothetical protein